METVKIITNIVLEPKSAQSVFDLPGGWITPDGELQKEVKVREMTGYEEDLLANQSIPLDKKMNSIMAACVERIGTETNPAKIASLIMDLSKDDRMFLLMAIRQVTFGDIVPMSYECPECSRVSSYNLPLSQLTVHAPKDPSKKVFELVTPSGKKVIFKTLTGHDEAKLSNIKEDTDTLSKMMAVRIDTIDGLPVNFMDLKRLSMKDRIFIRETFKEYDGGIDMEFDLDCPACGHQFKRNMELGQPGFFFPSMTKNP